jgi:integrase
MEAMRSQPLAIKNKLFGKEERQKTILEVYKYHNQRFEELVGKEYSIGTLKKIKTCLTSLQEFLKWKHNISDFPIKSLPHQFVTDYELDKDPFMSYKIKIRDTHRTYLLEDELQLLANKNITVERLDVVRDIFLFSGYTGLSHSDVEKLTSSAISTGIDGKKWIFTTRTKTGTLTRVPLLPPALAILDKYAKSVASINSGKLLPIIGNQRMNSYLKELADICGIKKELTFHCSRYQSETTL